MNRVVITGMGMLSPIGNTMQDIVKSLLEGKSGIRQMPEWRSVTGLGTYLAGTVTEMPPQIIPRAFRRTMGRMAMLGAYAAMDAVRDSGLDEAVLGSGRAGVAMGSTTGSPEALEQFFGGYTVRKSIREQEGTLFMKVMSHTVAANVSAVLGIRGQQLAPGTACASSTQAIGMGFEAIGSGSQDVMVCGGAEEVHPTTAGVFDIVHAASRNFNETPSRSPRPFDRDRDGLVVGEGGAALVLENYDHARKRGAAIYGEIAGYGTCCEPRHMTTPDVEGMRRCMQLAMASARIAPSDLSYINAHATGTILGDAAEAEATRSASWRTGDAVPVSSTKGYVGHTLGACGAMEAIFCLLMMSEGFLAPTLNLDAVAPDCEGIDHVREVRRCRPNLILSNNFAFGGVNASLVLKARP